MNRTLAETSDVTNDITLSEAQRRPTITILLNGILFVGAVAICVLLIEGILRIKYARSLDFSMEMWKYAVNLKRPVPNAQLSFAHIPGSHEFLMGADVNINSQGLRDYEYPLQKAPGTYRIMLLGDSTTFGWGVRQEDTSAKFLERKLNADLPSGYTKVEVLNAGVGNYDTVQEVTYYRTDGQAFHPDLVVLVFFINDPEPVPVEKKGFLLDRSYLLAFGTNRVDGVMRHLGIRPDWKRYYSSLYDDNRPAFQDCKNALFSLAESTASDYAQVLVAILPELHQINGDSYPFKAEHKKIRDILTPYHVPVVDLIEGLKDNGPEETLWVTSLDDHPNAKANNLVAEQLKRWVLSNTH